MNLGTYAMGGMLRYAFEDLSLHRAWLRVLAHNNAAIALYDKYAFIQEGVHLESSRTGLTATCIRWRFLLRPTMVGKRDNECTPSHVL